MTNNLNLKVVVITLTLLSVIAGYGKQAPSEIRIVGLDFQGNEVDIHEYLKSKNLGTLNVSVEARATKSPFFSKCFQRSSFGEPYYPKRDKNIISIDSNGMGTVHDNFGKCKMRIHTIRFSGIGSSGEEVRFGHVSIGDMTLAKSVDLSCQVSRGVAPDCMMANELEEFRPGFTYVIRLQLRNPSDFVIYGISPGADGIARNFDGSIKVMNQIDAISYCSHYGMHLPDVREMAQGLVLSGAQGISESPQWGYSNVSTISDQGEAKTFWFSHAGYYPSTGEISKNTFWSSSVSAHDLEQGLAVYGNAGTFAVLLRFSNQFAVRCF